MFQTASADRVVLLAPTPRDAELAQAIFDRANIECVCCDTLRAACRALEDGAAVLLIAEELVAPESATLLTRWVAAQPPWSDLPILVLARAGADSAIVARALRELGNVAILDRPMRVATLVSAVRAAQRARQRQYQVRDHLVERQRAASALRDADRRKDEFLAMLAHELRNPLAPLRNALHILRLADGDQPTVARVGAMMERQVQQLVRLVDDLLEVSRITLGKVDVQMEPVEFGHVLRAAIEASRPHLEEKRHTLQLQLPSRPITVHADPIRLAQVFTNLLNNAARYTDDGGHVEVVVAHAKDGTRDIVRVLVRDNGTGIDADELPHIFDMFAQFDARPSRRTTGGLGIGLTLVKNFVELHRGTVSVRSDGRGKGSTFEVVLPLAHADDVAPDTSNEPLRSADATHRRVLVVDDNRDVADSLGVLLRLLGSEVRIGYSGAEALAMLEAFQPSVVLLDLGMPKMDGFDVARAIRADERFAHVRLVACSGWGKHEDMRRSAEAGFDHHLTKPANVRDLQALLDQVV